MTRPSIVHISTSDSEGGSARSARRIHEGLRRREVLSRMLVGTKASADPDVDTVHGGGALRLADRAAEEATKRAGLQYLWYPSGRRVIEHPWIKEAGIIQLYNTHGGYISHRLLPALARRAPVVWRLSDMWSMTGHCAYAGPCERWRTGCGACPDLAAYPPLARDTTAFLWRTKRALYRRARPTIVAPSRWIADLARQSPLFENCSIVEIPNGIDLGIFRPMSKPAAREILGLPKDRRIVLFSAHVVDGNDRKGSAAAIQALNRLGPRDGLDIALLGLGGESWQAHVPQPLHRLGYIRDERLLAAAYAAADLSIAPASVENLPNAILESLACGTPVVAFGAGGIAEAVRHRETGWLAAPGDVDGLAAGIAAILDDDAFSAELAEGARRLALDQFGADREIAAFLDLYRSLRADRSAA